MGAGKYYAEEGLKYPAYFKQKISIEKAKQIIKELSRAYQFRTPQVYCYHRAGGCYYHPFAGGNFFKGQGKITLAKDFNLGFLLHEFTHHYCWVRLHSLRHNKRMKKVQERIFKKAEVYLEEV